MVLAFKRKMRTGDVAIDTQLNLFKGMDLCDGDSSA